MPTDLTNIGIIDFAANSWSAGTILGGTIREASGLAIQKIYAANQATADRTATGPDWSVFTDLLLRHDIVLDYSMFFDSPIYGLATLSPYVGIRARIQIEGNYTFEQGLWAHRSPCRTCS